MDTVTLWHNPACSKSRGALALLRQHGIEPDLRDYLSRPPDAAEIRALMACLALSARALLRAGEEDYVRLGLYDPALQDDALIATLTAHPHLIERPILVIGKRAVIARPLERLGEFLDGLS